MKTFGIAAILGAIIALANGESATGNATVDANATKAKCYTLMSSMAKNEALKNYPMFSGPISGTSLCEVCLDSVKQVGTIHCDVQISQRKNISPFIASHIHYAPNGNAKKDNGPPVINFCGSKQPINDGTPYSTVCNQINNKYQADQRKIKGEFVTGTNPQGFANFYQLLNDLVQNPSKYYYNYHSSASYDFWNSQDAGPLGIIRGEMLPALQ